MGSCTVWGCVQQRAVVGPRGHLLAVRHSGLLATPARADHMACPDLVLACRCLASYTEARRHRSQKHVTLEQEALGIGCVPGR